MKLLHIHPLFFTYRPLQSIMVFIMMALLPPKEIQSKTLENKPGRITYRLFLEFSSAYGRTVNYFHTPFPRKTQSVINRGSLTPKAATQGSLPRDQARQGYIWVNTMKKCMIHVSAWAVSGRRPSRSCLVFHRNLDTELTLQNKCRFHVEPCSLTLQENRELPGWNHWLL